MKEEEGHKDGDLLIDWISKRRKLLGVGGYLVGKTFLIDRLQLIANLEVIFLFPASE